MMKSNIIIHDSALYIQNLIHVVGAFSNQLTQKTQRQLHLRFMEIFLSTYTTTQCAMEQKLTSKTVRFQHLIPIRLVHQLALFSVLKVADIIIAKINS